MRIVGLSSEWQKSRNFLIFCHSEEDPAMLTLIYFLKVLLNGALVMAEDIAALATEPVNIDFAGHPYVAVIF